MTSPDKTSGKPGTPPYDFEEGGFFLSPPVTANDTLEHILARLRHFGPVKAADFKAALTNSVPILVFAGVLLWLMVSAPEILTARSLIAVSQQAGELGLVVLGMLIVVMVGGIDLSVGAMFALGNFMTLLLLQYFEVPLILGIPLVVLFGALLGAINGYLIGYLRLRAFLTTLITLIMFRAVYDYLVLLYGADISSKYLNTPAWNFIAFGQFFGFSVAFWAFLISAVLMHVVLTRLRPGWHILAIGGSRRAAHNAGVPVARTVMLCYAASGGLTAMSSVFYAARLSALGADVGVGLEIMILTSVIVGGNHLGGGKGSVSRAVLGLLIVLLLTLGLSAKSLSGGIVSMTLAAILLGSTLLEHMLERGWFQGSAIKTPDYLNLPGAPVVRRGGQGPWTLNDRLQGARVFAEGKVEGADDMAFDSKGGLYVGSKHGEILRFDAPNYDTSTVVAHIGSVIQGLAFDAAGNLTVSAGEMGIFRLAPDGSFAKVTDQISSRLPLFGAVGRLRFTKGVDVASDGTIYFTDNGGIGDLLTASKAGRLLAHDPKTGKTRVMLAGMRYPTGVCLAHDAQAILVAQSAEGSVLRYWVSGPQKGRREVIMSNLPGHPGHISRASDGTYWMSFIGGRTPALDLVWRMPGFGKRMAEQLGADDWPGPQMNLAAAIKFNDKGEVVETMWDINNPSLSAITSARENGGQLYLASSFNNRLGRVQLNKASAL